MKLKPRAWLLAVLASATLVLDTPPAAAQPQAGRDAAGDRTPNGRQGPEVIYPRRHVTSPPLREQPPADLPTQAGPKFFGRRYSRLSPPRIPRGPADADPVLQSSAPVLPPGPAIGFEGLSSYEQWPLLGTFLPVVPPDTNGDIGPNHYVQIVNLTYAVYDRQGQRLGPDAPNQPPIPNNQIWAALGAGSPCADDNDGDPIVLYDRLADRWLISQLAIPFFPSGPFYQCVAVSATPDPLGAFHLYEYEVSATKLNDYPKLGVWPDGYYLSANQYDNCRIDIFFGVTCDWAGPLAVAFERAEMLAGNPVARMVKFEVRNTNLGGMLPSHLGGFDPQDPANTVPPPGTPNYFVQVDDGAWFAPGTPDRLQVWPFHVDWGDPASSTFGPLPAPGVNPPPDTAFQLPVAAFDSNMCNYDRFCIPQPDPDILGQIIRVDALSDRLMHPLLYRKFPTHEALVTNHTVDVGGDQAGIRWYELRRTGGDWFIHQQGTYAPADGDHRWMGSMAMDGAGNIALGFSVSSLTTRPSLRYAGRGPCDPLGQLGPEQRIVDGGGSQIDSSSRWGDYSAMSVDPQDDRTFWYTSEYYAYTDDYAGANWQTRIAPFQVAACAQPAISIGNASVAEGNSGTTALVFTVTLSAASSQTVTVDYATANGTATAPGDYQAQAGTLTFDPGVVSRTITVLVNGDTGVEANETLAVNLQNPTNATIADAQGAGTILNDDGSITVTKPNGGESWRIGRRQNIQWTSSGVSGAVDIDLSLTGPGGPWIRLFGATPNDGRQAWTPPAGYGTTQGRIRVCNAGASICDASNANFTIRP